jgi:hypothetical protein
LGNIQVGDFDLPSGSRILPRDQTREGAFADTTFLGDQANESRHPHHLHHNVLTQ